MHSLRQRLRKVDLAVLTVRGYGFALVLAEALR
jgi:hypothetical protein